MPAAGSAEAKVKVTAGADEGLFPVTFALTDHTSGATLAGATLRVAVAKAGALWPYNTNEGVYPDGATFSGGFDGGVGPSRRTRWRPRVSRVARRSRSTASTTPGRP